VFIVRDGVAIEVPVTPGARVGDLTAITGAARTGDKAVLKPATDLASGAFVKIAPK
jgi:HlyD family secretion protein